MTKTDRRVQRTCDLLQNALIDLIHERSYDAITIQEIVARANVGVPPSICTTAAKTTYS